MRRQDFFTQNFKAQPQKCHSCLWDHEDELLSIYSLLVNFHGCIENINNCDQLIIMGPIIPADLIALSGLKQKNNKEKTRIQINTHL